MSDRLRRRTTFLVTIGLLIVSPAVALEAPPVATLAARLSDTASTSVGLYGARSRSPFRLALFPQQQEEEEPQAPAPRDAIGGFQLSIIGGTQLTGKSSLQLGGTAAYFFRPKSAIGFEIEGSVTFGPDGKVLLGLASLVLQSGARTSRIVPYLAIGGGYVYSKLQLGDANAAALADLGIVIDPNTESGPAVAFGGGVRYYFREGFSVRGDFRDVRVLRDNTGGESFFDRIYALRRIAAILTFDF